MTVLTKASDMGRKPDLINAPLVEFQRDLECVPPRRKPRIYHVWVYRSRYCQSFLTCFSFCLLSMVLTGAVLGLIYYTVFHETVRYRGYCAIPIEVPRDIMMQDARFQKQMETMRMPLRWTEDPDVTVYTTVDAASTGDALNSLLERFEIDDNVEKISIFNSGNNVEFIHDFNANATGIVDQKRCFTMDLDPNMVLNPGVFVFSIQRGDAFDIMRVRTELHAVLPPAPHLLSSVSSIFAERCGDKPTYKLEKGEDIIRRKRSADEPAHEYMHFAGKHLQEIAIDNLDALLEYEKNLSA